MTSFSFCLLLLLSSAGCKSAPTQAADAAPKPVAQPSTGEAADPCSIARGLSEPCGRCARANCCQPPIRFESAVALALGCYIGARKGPPGGWPTLDEGDRQRIVETTLQTCSQIYGHHPDAAALAACLFERCVTECGE